MTAPENPTPNKPQHPSQRDAERLKRHYPLSFLLKLLALLVGVFLIICVIFYFMAGTPRGTKFIVEKVISETGVDIEYEKGDLRDGLVVKDIALSVNKDIDVHFINTYVKIGWRSIFTKEVHLRDAEIDEITIVNKKPPTGDPFEYNKLELPVNLRFDRARINKITYNQATKEPVEVTDIAADDLNWVGTKLEVASGNLQYSDVVNIADLKGFIDLQDSYPLDLDATVTVNSFEKIYIDPLKVQAAGSLKRTYGLVSSKYNNSNVKGEFVVQGLDDNAPFDAKLTWDEATVPYAESQDITLQNGLAVASGVISDIDLRVKTRILAKDIPAGQYQARARISDNQMRIDHLLANTPEGRADIKGILDWNKDFNMKLLARANGFEVSPFVPEEARPYAPDELDGQLAFILYTKNNEGLLQINADLRQRDGEHLNAKLVQGREPENPRYNAPWFINGKWQNYIRKDVPNIGNIKSPSGTGEVTLRDNRIWVNANAKINELNVAPIGDYDVKLSKVNNKIDIRSFIYNGEVGSLSGKGNILLATKNKPLNWQLSASTKELLLNKYNKKIPVKRLVGDIDAKGQLINITKKVNGKTLSGQRHVITVADSDLKGVLTSEVTIQNTSNANKNNTRKSKETTENRFVSVSGIADATIEMIDGELQNFDARYKGSLDSQGVPKGQYDIDARGNLNNITIQKFNHEGEAGSLNASGKVNLVNGIGWDIKANAKSLNIGFFTPKTEGIVSGNLITSGKWREKKSENKKEANGVLESFNVKFDGSVDTPSLPKGKLSIDAGGNAQAIQLRKFSHVGAAGELLAKGTIDVTNGIAWNINAVMDRFNVGYFVKDMPSSLTGKVSTTGVWKDSEQQIKISQLNVNGQLKNKPLVARGNLNTVLHLPKDMDAYFQTLKAADIKSQTSQVNKLIESLNVDDLLIKWSDNEIVANGNAERLQAKVNINSLYQLSDSLTGSVVGGLTLVQPKGRPLPTIYVDLTSEKITLPNFVLNAGTIKGKIVDLAKSESKLVVSASGLETSASNFNDIQLVFDGTEKSHTLAVNGKTKRGTTEVGISAALKGGLERDSKRWRGVIGSGNIATDYVSLKQNQPAQFVASFAGESPQFELAAHCWQATDQSGKLCLRDKLVASANKGQVNLAIQKIDTTLFTPFLPKDISWKAKLNGKALVNWQRGAKPSINATLFSDNGKIGMTQEGDSDITLPYKRVSLIVRSFNDGLKIRTDINSGTGARGYADIVVDPFKEDKPISGALVLNEFNLAILKPFFPGMRTLGGNITMAGGLGGTLSSPVFFGDANLRNANISTLDLPVNLTNVNAKAKIRGQKATLDGTFMSGEGTGSLTGSINWQQELQAKLRLRGERLVVTQPPLLFAEVSPDVNIIVKPKQKYVNIVGAVSVPTATIRPPEANEEVITKSSDVVVLDRRLIGNIEQVLAVSKPWSINADIGIDLGKDVEFRGFGAVLPLAGAINVTQKGQGVMNALGVVQVSRRSEIDAFGQNLELNYGQVRFEGDVVNPRLSIEAVKEIEGQTVGVRVKGNVSEPNIVVFNDAGLTEQQAMNALVTGRISNPGTTQISEQGFKSEVTNNLAAAGLSLGLSGTRNLTNTVGDALGLQRLTIDASGNDNDANVNVTGYITPDLYIRYGVGVFNAQSELTLRYQLTNRIYVEAKSSTENAIDFVYSFQF